MAKNKPHKHFDSRTVMVSVIAIFLLFTFLNTIVTNPMISGYSVVDAETQDTERFSNTTAILFVVFGFFGLFLFILKRKMR
jgi:hypothetical protein